MTKWRSGTRQSNALSTVLSICKKSTCSEWFGYNHSKTKKLAERMYELIFDMKFLPPGRGLWAMGSPITEERKLYAALNSCAFVSTNDQLRS